MDTTKSGLQDFSTGATVTDGTQTAVDYSGLEEIASSLLNYGDDILTQLLKIADEIKWLETYEQFKTIVGSVSLQDAIAAIKEKFTNYDDLITELGNFLTKVVEKFKESDIALGKAFEDWYAGVQSVISGVITAANTTLGEGETYSASQWFSDLTTSVSNTTQTLVKETTTMIANSSKLYSKIFGHSLAQGVENIATAAVGTVKTLFGWITGSNSVASGFVGNLLK